MMRIALLVFACLPCWLDAMVRIEGMDNPFFITLENRCDRPIVAWLSSKTDKEGKFTYDTHSKVAVNPKTKWSSETVNAYEVVQRTYKLEICAQAEPLAPLGHLTFKANCFLTEPPQMTGGEGLIFMFKTPQLPSGRPRIEIIVSEPPRYTELRELSGVSPPPSPLNPGEPETSKRLNDNGCRVM